MKVIKDRVALFTGGASGIGYGMVQNFLREQYNSFSYSAKL